jgi:hypothetical protein
LLCVIPAQAAGKCGNPDACRLIVESESQIFSLSPQQLTALGAAVSRPQDETATKVISRNDSTDASITGPVVVVGDLNFTGGHPFRVLILHTRTWMDQLVPLVCFDNFAASCGSLRTNQRIATASNIFTFQDGDFLALSLFYVRVLRTR